MTRSPPTLLLCLTLATGISLCWQAYAAQSATELLVEAEEKLATSGRFAVDYSVRPQNNADWPGVVLGGRLVVQSNNSCFLTNSGGISIIPAAMTVVSDEKSYLVVHHRGVEWIPERSGPLNLKEVAGLLPRGGMLPVVLSVAADIRSKTDPDPEPKNRSPRLSKGEFNITNAQEFAAERMPGGTARHIRFDVAYGTNQAESVDLWLDAHSGLPVKRVSRPRDLGELMTETYSFSLNPIVPTGFFDPKRLAREMKLEAYVAAAEKPSARLLRGALWGDDDLVREALDAGADANTRTSVPMGHPGPQLSALMLASMSGDERVVDRLLKAGAEINASAPSGATALDFAVIYHYPAIADWLKSHGGKEGKRAP
jgi:hypothetical protein